MLKPAGTLEEVLCFTLGVDSIEGTVIEKRIVELCAEAFGDVDFSPEELNQNSGMFNSEQIDFIKSELRDFLYFFNFADHPLDADPNTCFFEYSGTQVDHDEEKLIELYNGYLKQN